MKSGVNAYARAAQTAMSPREIEASVLMKSATRLQAIRDDWDGRRADLGDALQFNQKLWTILVTAVTDNASAVPAAIRQSIVDLGVFTFTRTAATLAEPDADKLAALVNINKEVAAGLRAQPVQAAA